MSNEWMDGLIEKLKDFDVATLIDMLELTSLDIVQMFETEIEENAETLAKEIGYQFE